MLFHVSCRWSLLEKYSCKASKLHLKPRRFKLFLEALVSLQMKILFYSWIWQELVFKLFSNKPFIVKEHQLLKDRRKSSRKRACHGESFSSASLGNISSHSRERGLDSSPFKLILCDSQNVRPGRASTKHGESLGVRLGDEKEDTALGRAGRQRRKQGTFSTSLYACSLDRQFSLASYSVFLQCSYSLGHDLLYFKLLLKYLM